MNRIHCAFVESPLGRVLVAASEAGLVRVSFGESSAARLGEDRWSHETATLGEAVRQLRAYFAGELRAFDLPLAPGGTPFQLQVWRLLGEVAYGTTTTYAALAARLGRASAARAVGAANGRNPLAVVVPCHRVVGGDGALRGYAGGLERKRALLDLEARAAARAA